MARTSNVSQEEPSLLRQQIVGLIQSLRRSINPIRSEEWAQLDLTMPQLKAVIMLDAQGPMPMSRLAGALGVATPTATGIIDRLEERGLVVRESEPSDRRVVNCGLSNEGREIVSTFWELGRWEIENLISSLSNQDLEVVADALSILCRAAQHNARDLDAPLARAQ